MTRRKMIATVAAIPARYVLSPDSAFAFSRGIATRIQELSHEFNPDGGDIGRANWSNRASIQEALDLLPALDAFGFKRYTLLSKKYFPVFGASGAPLALVWHAFVRESDGKYEAVCFEHTLRDCVEFKASNGAEDYMTAFRKAEDKIYFAKKAVT